MPYGFLFSYIIKINVFSDLGTRDDLCEILSTPFAIDYFYTVLIFYKHTVDVYHKKDHDANYVTDKPDIFTWSNLFQ